MAAADRCPRRRRGRDGRKEGDRAGVGRSGVFPRAARRWPSPPPGGHPRFSRLSGGPRVFSASGRAAGYRPAGRPALLACLRSGHPFSRWRLQRGRSPARRPGRAEGSVAGAGASLCLPRGLAGAPRPCGCGSEENRFLICVSDIYACPQVTRGAAGLPGLGRAQLPPSAPGVAAAPACGRVAGGCQVPPSPAGRGDFSSVLRPGSTVCEVRGALLFSFPLSFPCISHPHQDSVPVARGFLQGSFYLDPS